MLPLVLAEKLPKTLWRAFGICMLPAILASNSTRAFAQSPKTGSGDASYSIQRVFKPGDLSLYKLVMNIHAKGESAGNVEQDIQMIFIYKELVKDISSEGTVTLLEEYPNVEVTVNGAKQDITSQLPKVTLKRDRADHIDVTTDGGSDQVNAIISGMAKQILESSLASLPKKPIKVGDTWTADYSSTIQDQSATIKAVVKLESVEVLDGKTLLKLVSTTEGSSKADADTKVHGESTIYIDSSTGKPVKMRSKVNVVGPLNKVTVNMSLDPATKEDTKPAKKQAAPK